VSLNALPTTEVSTLLLESAIVTVGTGLTGAIVTRSVIQQDDPSLTYTPASAWITYNFDDYGIPHPSSNTTYCQVNTDTSGSVTIPFSGNAVFVYGTAWAYGLSAFRVSLDGQAPRTIFINSSITGQEIAYDGLLFSQFNPTSSSHELTIDNDNGLGSIGLDYIEIVTVTGGSSYASQHHATPIVAIVVPVVVGVLVMAILFRYVYKCIIRNHNLAQGEGAPGVQAKKSVEEPVDKPVDEPVEEPVEEPKGR